MRRSFDRSTDSTSRPHAAEGREVLCLLIVAVTLVALGVLFRSAQASAASAADPVAIVHVLR